MPSFKRNKRVNDIEVLISKTNTHVLDALDIIVKVMNDPNSKPSDALTAASKYINFYIQFRDKKQEWEDRELKRQLLKLNIKQKKNPNGDEKPQTENVFSLDYDGNNDDYLMT